MLVGFEFSPAYQTQTSLYFVQILTYQIHLSRSRLIPLSGIIFIVVVTLFGEFDFSHNVFGIE